MSTNVHYNSLNISQLRLGDIVEMENNTMKYGVMTVTNLTTRPIATAYHKDTNTYDYKQVPFITMERPHIEVYGKGEISRHTERIDAYADHSGLNYSVDRDVYLFENQIISYQDKDWRIIRVNPDGRVTLEDVTMIGHSEQLGFIEVPEMQLNWDYPDWDDDKLKFYDPRDRKIKTYDELYPKAK